MARRVAFAALLVNAALCAGWAERVDTFIISTAILTAALIVAVAVAPLPAAGATSPRASFRCQRGAAGGPLARTPVRNLSSPRCGQRCAATARRFKSMI